MQDATTTNHLERMKKYAMKPVELPTNDGERDQYQAAKEACAFFARLYPNAIVYFRSNRYCAGDDLWYSVHVTWTLQKGATFYVYLKRSEFGDFTVRLKDASVDPGFLKGHPVLLLNAMNSI